MTTSSYRAPELGRNILLPPYMHSAMWTDLTKAIDNLFLDTDVATTQLRNLRNPYTVGPAIREAINSGKMFDTTHAEYQQDMQTLLKQITFCGLPLNSPTYLTTTQALLLFRNLGAYWYGKGTGKIIDFLNFTLGSSLSMVTLWTADYVTFEPESIPDINGNLIFNPFLVGKSIGEGGEWYPTTHVTMTLGTSPAFAGVTSDTFLQFFNDVFNYNLVLYSITDSLQFDIGPPKISMGLYVEVEASPYDMSLQVQH